MIAGVATVTIVVSTRIMKNPRQSANSAGHGLTSDGIGSRVGAGWAMTGLNTSPGTLIPPADRHYTPMTGEPGPISQAGRMSHVDLMAGPPPTHLPADPADAELAGGDAPG